MSPARGKDGKFRPGDRLDPDALSWPITTETIFRDELEFHRLDGDRVFIERYNDETDSWITYDDFALGDLRLTLLRGES